MFLLRSRISSTLPRLIRLSSTTTTSEAGLNQEFIPSVLNRLRDDLKTALRSKDQPRLAVVRSLIPEIGDASKSEKPVLSASAFLSLVNKRIKQSQDAAQEFEKAGRTDLVQKEEGQRKVLEEYSGLVKVVGPEELQEIIDEVAEGLTERGERTHAGLLMGLTMKALGDRAADNGVLSKLVKEFGKKYMAANK